LARRATLRPASLDCAFRPAFLLPPALPRKARAAGAGGALARAAGLFLLILFAAPQALFAQTVESVLVVTNEASPDSLRVAEHYAKRRQIPGTQVIRIRTAVADELARAEFEREIQAPISDWLTKNSAQDRILYIVLTKGVPLRIAGLFGRAGTVSSVDSELALLYRRLTGRTVSPVGPVSNPYFLGDAAVDSAERFSHRTHDIYLVTRLDGFTVDDVLALIERGAAPVSNGRVLLDQRMSLTDAANDWLARAAEKLKAQGLGGRVALESSSRVLEHETDVLGYYSWGSNDSRLTVRQPDLQFVPGALAAMFVSTDARTFKEPPPDWKPGGFDSRKNYFAGSPQSLTGDLIRAGVTGVAGHVAEPYLDRSVRPDILFPAYVAGFNLAEAFYLAIPALSWQTVVIGDPLCAPFSRPPIPASDLDPEIDTEIGLPSRFAQRRLAAGIPGTSNAEVVRLVVRAAARAARDDSHGARQLLEQAVALDDRVLDAWRALGTLYDKAGEFDNALAAYRKVVQHDPKDFVALNNLAYSLAVRQNRPKEALPFAERAVLLAPRNAFVADTLGWIRHLVGDDQGAIRLLVPASKALPQNAEVQLHVAIAYTAVGRLDEAAAALKNAERLDPAVKDRPEFKDAMLKIGRRTPFPQPPNRNP
jgi:uncharacterized protein (TIGR03790 family)